VQPFFVSEEKLARQAYRYDARYRLAAFVLIAAVLFQVPFLGCLYYQNRISEEEEIRGGAALRKNRQITTELGSLKETETQLGQIRAWEPILRGRLPASAVLGAIEQTIPSDVVLSRITLEAANYRSISIGSSSFRVPMTCMITLDGEQKGSDPGIWGKFVAGFLSRLPPGSDVVTSTAGKGESPKSSSVACKAVLQAQANGNYFPLGVNRTDAEENL
jgi:hypothetical protein